MPNPMLDNFYSHTLGTMVESSQLRSQALDLFDRCLIEGNSASIVAFIERQVMSDPPPLQALRDFAEDLQVRLLSLRSYHFDVRENVVKTILEGYGIDITPLTPADAPDRYHLLDPQQVLTYIEKHGVLLGVQDRLLLGKLLETSIRMAARLSNEIRLAVELQTLLLDWLEALNTMAGRHYWSGDTPAWPSAIH